MINFLSGIASTLYVLVGVCFLKFWRRTHDRLFGFFALAFGLFALNQIVTTFLNSFDDRTGYVYILRILGFGVIVYAIVDKNTPSAPKQD